MMKVLTMNYTSKQSEVRMYINLYLLTVCFTIFALIVSLNSTLLNNFLFSIQLVSCIPLFFSSILARSKLGMVKRPELWDIYGHSTFLLGYSFLINVVGILFASAGNPNTGIIFLIINICCALFYSAVEMFEDSKKVTSRLRKDLFFILVIIVGGILPALRVY